MNDEHLHLIREIQEAPNNYAPYYNLGVTFTEQGDYLKAQQCYEKALFLNPACGEAYNNLAGIFTMTDRLDEAIRLYDKAMQICPDNVEICYNAAKLYEEIGEFEKSLACCKRAVALNVPESYRYLYESMDEEYLVRLKKFSRVDGFLQGLEGYTLMMAAAKLPGSGEIVEIGSFMGRSTCWLATGAKRAGRERVTAIDIFKKFVVQEGKQIALDEGSNFHQFMQNLETALVNDYVDPIVASSEEAVLRWDKPIRLLFIDGDHSYDMSKKDFELWNGFVVPGGFVCFHDIGIYDGVTVYYHELIKTTEAYDEALTAMSMKMLRKKR